MRARLCFAFVLAASALASLPAAAADTKSLGRHGDWEAIVMGDKASKMCYIASVPKKKGGDKTRGSVGLSITNRPADKSFDVVQISAGYAFKKDSAAEMTLGKTKFSFYTQGDGAWTRDDKAVVQALLKAKPDATLAVHGTPAKGTPIDDTYSLKGFVPAYQALTKACGPVAAPEKKPVAKDHKAVAPKPATKSKD